MRKCDLCHIEKEIVEFNKNKTKKDGISTVCRDCNRKIGRAYYAANRTSHKKVTARRRAKQIADNRRFIREYLRQNPCIDCAEPDIVVLEFDHVRGVKYKNVTKLVTNGCSIARIKEEIEKCVVRCANCHRRKTAKERPNDHRIIFVDA